MKATRLSMSFESEPTRLPRQADELVLSETEKENRIHTNARQVVAGDSCGTASLSAVKIERHQQLLSCIRRDCAFLFFCFVECALRTPALEENALAGGPRWAQTTFDFGRAVATDPTGWGGLGYIVRQTHGCAANLTHLCLSICMPHANGQGTCP